MRAYKKIFRYQINKKYKVFPTSSHSLLAAFYAAVQ